MRNNVAEAVAAVKTKDAQAEEETVPGRSMSAGAALGEPVRQ